jgi:hypothetical protein
MRRVGWAPLYKLITGLPNRAVTAAAHAHRQLTDYVLPERPDDGQQDRPSTTPVATANRHDQSTPLVRFPLVTSASSLPSASADRYPNVTEPQPGAAWGEGPRQAAM